MVALAAELQPPGLADREHQPLGGVGIDPVRPLARRGRAARRGRWRGPCRSARASRRDRPRPAPPCSSRPFARSVSTKRQAAVIGPIVCELDGPTPILNRSNVLQTKRPLLGARHEPGAREVTRPDGPFVLLDDARPGGETWLHAEPREIVATRDPAEVRDCLARLRGRDAAGFIAYEAGHALEPKLAPLAQRARRRRAALALVRPVRSGRAGRSRRLPARSGRRLARPPAPADRGGGLSRRGRGGCSITSSPATSIRRT